MRNSFRNVMLLLALVLSVSLSAAEEAVQWQDLSAPEREVLAPLEDKWKTLSPQRQQRLRKGAARWQGLDANQREQFKHRYQKWSALAPEDRKKIRQRYQRFRALPESEQTAHPPGTQTLSESAARPAPSAAGKVSQHVAPGTATLPARAAAQETESEGQAKPA